MDGQNNNLDQTVSNEVLGHRIKTRRMEKGDSLQEVADKARVQSSTVYRYESGAIAKPKIPVVEAIAKALDISADYLLGRGPFRYWDKILADLDGFMAAVAEYPEWLWAYDLYPDEPSRTDINELRTYISERVNEVLLPTGASSWKIVLSAPTDKKPPDTLIDIEGLSEDRRYLVEKIIALSDDRVHTLRSIVEQIFTLADS